jgi:flagellar basal-body rod protein FlgG
MLKGFYNLTSGMITQQRYLNVVSNNITNISTAGYKEERYVGTTFGDAVYDRIGESIPQSTTVGPQSYILTTSNIYTNYEQGVPEPTGLPLDFAIQGDGFFAVQQEDGQVAYTRSGSFSLDEEGYLCLPGQGRVLDPNGQEILLGTDRVTGDGFGRIYTEEGNGYLGQVGVYNIEDTETLEHNDQGLFTGVEGTAMDTPQVYWGYLERSNVDMVKQMTEMLTCQRSLQSAAEVLKMYDTLIDKATTSLGQI